MDRFSQLATSCVFPGTGCLRVPSIRLIIDRNVGGTLECFHDHVMPELEKVIKHPRVSNNIEELDIHSAEPDKLSETTHPNSSIVKLDKD